MKILSRILFAILVCSFPRAVVAQDIEVGTGLVCDSASQVERFIALYDPAKPAGAFARAVTRVNSESGKDAACGLATIAYLRGGDVRTVRSGAAFARIVEVSVVGVHVGEGVRPIATVTQYILLPVAGEQI